MPTGGRDHQPASPDVDTGRITNLAWVPPQNSNARALVCACCCVRPCDCRIISCIHCLVALRGDIARGWTRKGPGSNDAFSHRVINYADIVPQVLIPVPLVMPYRHSGDSVTCRIALSI